MSKKEWMYLKLYPNTIEKKILAKKNIYNITYNPQYNRTMKIAKINDKSITEACTMTNNTKLPGPGH